MSEPTNADISARDLAPAEIALRDGAHFVLRAVRPDDEPRLRDMFARASNEDIHFRCFGAMHHFAADMAHRLAHLDPIKEFALAALTPPDQGPEEIFGVVHLAQNPEAPDTAEFDIMVRSDCKQRGLGYRLMTEILESARQRELKAVTGTILRDNYTMLQMAHELGFATENFEGDVVRVKVNLAQTPTFAAARPEAT